MKGNNERAKLFSEMPVRRAILTLAIPTVISQLITVVYNMADTFFIGQLGDLNQVAAATVFFPVVFVQNSEKHDHYAFAEIFYRWQGDFAGGADRRASRFCDDADEYHFQLDTE